MDSFTNSGDPDEMTHNVAFHQGLHCLIRSKDLQTKKISFLKLLPDTLDMYKEPSQVYWKNPFVYTELSGKLQVVKAKRAKKGPFKYLQHII